MRPPHSPVRPAPSPTHQGNRRAFLKMSAAGTLAATLMPGVIQRALALPAARRSGTLEDVAHIVVFMQENRSFDHYFGTLRGVRGYNDRFPIALPNGRPVWFQPRQDDPTQAVLPFHLDTHATSAQCVGDLDHTWARTHAAFNGGRHDRWPATKTDMTMGFHRREDIPFHYALADAFTVCDHYFCAIPGSTHPNRFYLMSGMVDPTGQHGGPQLDNDDAVIDPAQYRPLTWTTYPERLQTAGVSWRIYQQGTDFHDDEEGNYGTNMLPAFRQFIDAAPGSPLHERGMTARRLEDLRADVLADRLPQVSWILPPAIYSEHPQFTPAYGAAYTARVLAALTANPEVWAKTALFIMYDENDGFFDHMVPPSPPTPVLPGKSTVTTAGEVHTVVNPHQHRHYQPDQLPYGLGPRVPMTVVSPWTKGGHVCSEVFDHTSVIRFIETRFGVREPNITPWRRAVCGDLTSAFDFSLADATPARLPDTSHYRALADQQCRTLDKPGVPAPGTPTMPTQEPGTRPTRPLPYRCAVDAVVTADRGQLTLAFHNRGTTGAHFHVYRQDRDEAPRRYTVEAGKSLDDQWDTSASGGRYALAAHGANGFFRALTGDATTPEPLLTQQDDPAAGTLTLCLRNPTPHPLTLTIADTAYGAAPRRHTLAPGATLRDTWALAGNHHWYDLTLTQPAHPAWTRRLAGHLETGRASITDPAATAPVLVFA